MGAEIKAENVSSLIEKPPTLALNHFAAHFLNLSLLFYGCISIATNRKNMCVCVCAHACKEEPMHAKASRGEPHLSWDDGTTAGHAGAHAAFIIYLTSPAGASSMA